jgi:hypothetical protein
MALVAAPAGAWSEMAHRIVGDLAELRLSEATRAQVKQLLEGEPEPGLGGVAAWADALRYEDPDRFRISVRWHFINATGGGCAFDERRDCPGGQCVVAAINTQRRILADRSLPRPQRRDALKFIVHFVGDVHQPLHAGPREDRGGNQFQIQLRGTRRWRGGDDAGTNLHTVWDAHVLASSGLTRVEYVQRLKDVLPEEPGPVDERAPLRWARESCELVEAAQLYPDGHVIGLDYLDAYRPLAEQRLMLAAVRLAALLEETLGGSGDSGGYSRSRSR